MKIIWSIKSIPEFEGLDRLSAKEEWMTMYRKVRSEGDCRFAPLLCGGVCVLVMLLIVLLMAPFPSIPDLARFIIMIAFAGVGGHLGGVLAMSLNYRAGKKYLSRDRLRAIEEDRDRAPKP